MSTNTTLSDDTFTALAAAIICGTSRCTPDQAVTHAAQILTLVRERNKKDD